ncbi:UDP-N-acetylmuramate dehydrogenase [Evansella sp. LMS18]|uniref:UDP-N-acetylmuramate dehydrogenase n=1 Tax=Evansella sp. LMS18 TaxID=2924033 RepID=UPI0020D16C69|nr:UDP-N-acetylmuramate dehydrogenase [Evansella sp. LMS18]UTR12849.1 UDP-N-acetylmuramate dehydrogenase [Evansella sp. LMS18]
MENLLRKLEELNVGKIKENEPLKNHTTWKIGGPARIFYEPDTAENLQTAMKEIIAAGVPWLVVGKGSNLLVSDKGINGVVIKFGENFAHYEIKDEKLLRVTAGYSVIKLTTLISKQGFSGFEFAGGIPGTIGGAVFMNAGAHGSDISKILKRALILLPDGSFKWYTNEEMDYSYRTSRLQKEDGICVEAEFNIQKGDKEKITKEMQANKDYRRESQPFKHPTCGSVFRNPLPKYAGRLIEEAGLKGYSVGGAQISDIHANFIVNNGDATAKDVMDLIKHVQTTIHEKFGVKMETEVEQVGDH